MFTDSSSSKVNQSSLFSQNNKPEVIFNLTSALKGSQHRIESPTSGLNHVVDNYHNNVTRSSDAISNATTSKQPSIVPTLTIKPNFNQSTISPTSTGTHNSISNTSSQPLSPENFPKKSKKGLNMTEVENFDIDIPNSKKAICHNCLRIVKRKVTKYKKRHVAIKKTSKMGITLISTCTTNRISFIPKFVKLWPSNMVIALQVKKCNKTEVIKTIKKMALPSRFQIILKVTRDSISNFYVNQLRNIAISAIHTTHFLFVDMDLRPLPNLYDELMQLPSFITNDKKSAVIVPIAFLDHRDILNKCQTLDECSALSEERFPKSKQELYDCYQKGDCLLSKRGGVQHKYTSPQWFNFNTSFVKMKCFKNKFQEPYLLLRYYPNMKLFDERFINYGCNKVQYINELRLMGYDFYLLSNSFMMDIVHHDSKYREHYMVFARASMTTKMRTLCDYYLAKTDMVYQHQEHVNICRSLYE